MRTLTSDVLCPACGTKNRYRLTIGGTCTRCRKSLPTVVPRGLVYGVRSVLGPLLVIILVATVIYVSPRLRHEYTTYFAPR